MTSALSSGGQFHTRFLKKIHEQPEHVAAVVFTLVEMKQTDIFKQMNV